MSTVPTELHLTFKEQWEWKSEDWDKPLAERIKIIHLPLAFANAYEPSKKGWEKKKDTQMKWAYGTWHSSDFEVREDGVWRKEYEWRQPNPQALSERVQVGATRVEEYLQPRIIKNEPLNGFKISHSVSRYSTSNKLWRIKDPRGFELEISTGNMEEILMTRGVVMGEITGTYRWVGKTLQHV